MTENALLEVPPRTKEKRPNVYELTMEAQDLWAWLEELQGDISNPAIANEIEARLVALDENSSAKLDSIGYLIKECELLKDGAIAQAEVLEGQAKSWREKAKGHDSTIGRLKELAKMLLAVLPEKKMKTPHFSWWMQKDSKAPVIISETVDINKVPKRFLKTEISKASVFLALEAGEKLDWAHLGEPGEGVRVR